MPRNSDIDRNDSEDAHWERLARYTSNEAPASEREDVERWLQAHPAEAETLRNLDALVERVASRSTTGPIDVEAALRTAHARHETVVRPLRRSSPIPAAAVRFARPWRAAAALALIIGGGLAVKALVGANGVSSPVVYTAAAGAPDTVRLGDGSHVVLAPSSSLRLASGFGEQHRQVELIGLAFFDVVHDEARPFIVTARGTEFRDIGTSFTIRNDSGQAVSVAVHTGIVEMRSDQLADPVILHDGDRAELGDALRVSRGSVTETPPAWTSGTLTFSDATVQQVAEEARRWYGAEFRFAPALMSKKLNGDYKGLDELVQAMSIALDAEVVRQGVIVQLRPKGVAPR